MMIFTFASLSAPIYLKKLLHVNSFLSKVCFYTKITAFSAIFALSSVFAHPGRTDAGACHKNRKTGNSHCHKLNGSDRSNRTKRGSQALRSSQKSAVSSGYKRKEFGAWLDADGDCQNTRHEVLIEESLIPVVFKTSKQCKVLSGKWRDPYSGRIFTDPSLLDIDHVVPLKEAFLSGASAWSIEKKRRYANELIDKNHLIAVSRSANRSKGAKDPARWLPSDSSYRREYVRIWTEIKKRWGLKMDTLETRAIRKILGSK